MLTFQYEIILSFKSVVRNVFLAHFVLSETRIFSRFQTSLLANTTRIEYKQLAVKRNLCSFSDFWGVLQTLLGTELERTENRSGDKRIEQIRKSTKGSSVPVTAKSIPV